VVKSLKKWFKLTHPRKALLFWQVVFSILEKVTLILITIPTARIISSVTVANYDTAVVNVKYSISLSAIFCIFSFVSIALGNFQEKTIVKNVEGQLFSHIFSVPTQTFNDLSKQKIVNILSNSAMILADFSREFCDFFGNFAQFLLIFFIIAYSNVYLAAIVLGVCLVFLLLYIIITAIESFVTRNNVTFLDTKRAMTSDIINGIEVARDFNLIKEQKENIEAASFVAQKGELQENNFSSAKKLCFYMLASVAAGIITIYMTKLLRLDYLTLTLFILLIPYLTQVLNLTLNAYQIIGLGKRINQECKRCDYILSIDQGTIIALGDNATDLIQGNLVISSLTIIENKNKIFNKLSAGFVKNSLNNLVFNNLLAQNTFISLLRRSVKPTSGTITIDSINIFDFSPDAYVHNLTIVKTKPFFFGDTIYNNLKTSGASKREITAGLKALKIYDNLSLLPLGIHSKICEVTSDLMLYLLNIARALLSKAEIIVFDGIPTSLSPSDYKAVVNLISNIAKRKTVIVCSTFNLNLPGATVSIAN